MGTSRGQDQISNLVLVDLGRHDKVVHGLGLLVNLRNTTLQGNNPDKSIFVSDNEKSMSNISIMPHSESLRNFHNAFQLKLFNPNCAYFAPSALAKKMFHFINCTQSKFNITGERNWEVLA